MSRGQLRSEVVAAGALGPRQVRELFAIFARHYDCVEPRRFEHDLEDKSHVILLRDAASGAMRGFSTQRVLRGTVLGETVRAIFSGDTIIDRESWGEQELVRGWCRFAGQVRAEEPETRLFWFLISKGCRTYLYLPLFYREFYPRREKATPEFEQSLLDTLATRMFGAGYEPLTGLIRFPNSIGQLNPHLAQVSPSQLRNPHVQFFLARNPDFADGVELACLAEIAAENMRGLAAAMLREGEGLGAIGMMAQHV